jgi:carboxyl-terminal processing protease
MKLRPSRAIFSLVIVLIVSAMLGGIFGKSVQATTKESSEDYSSSLQLYSTLLGLVEENYATEVDPDKAVYGSIDGMLRTLDPHSKFFTPKEFASLKEDQHGQYFGLGITVTTRFGKVTVVSPPFKDSPAEKAGLRVGDVIAYVNGESTKNMELNEVVSKLKGPRGTTVHIKVIRAGVDEPVEMAVTRDEIKKYTINTAFLIKPRIGYVKLDSFAETSGQELRDALKKLDYKSMDGLIFDLRGNPGGLLAEAIEIGETFLQKGQLIVETRGRTRGSNRPYASQKVNGDNLYPIVVLINKNSASASEIVSGALQDHDRAIVVGETSFGKGLVQSVYTLQKNAGLALTTQKWYTPSGRLIQRDYSKISQFDYYNHLDAPAKKDDVKYSDLGRVVYGGGGITPDYLIPEDKTNDFRDNMARHYVFFTFARDFLAKNPPVAESFEVNDAVLDQFKAHLHKRNIDFNDKEFQDNKDFLKRSIQYEIVYDRLGNQAAQRAALDGDPYVEKALSLMPEARTLAEKARKALAAKQN